MSDSDRLSSRPSFKRGRIGGLAIILLSVVAGLLIVFARTRSGGAVGSSAGHPETSTAHNEVILACPGRVEGLSELVEVGSGIDGILGRVLVREGQHVTAGQVLAVIDRGDTDDDLRAALAAADASRQTRALLIRGSREEERSGATADTAAAQADLKQAELRYQRLEQLFREGVVSTDSRDQALRDMDVSRYKYRSTSDRERFVKKDPLPEELAKADADIRAADDLVAKAKETLEKCKIKAPLSGTILRCDMKAGETVSTVFPKPIITMADTSRLRVRAEVDERDIGRISVGQKVRVLVDALPDKSWTGTVLREEGLMGRKKVRTGDPAEKSDRDILEVLIDLDDQAKSPLVIGLRVTAQFLNGT
jgi:HlyD family secretion protein